MREIAGIERNCRLIKGQVFLWKDGKAGKICGTSTNDYAAVDEIRRIGRADGAGKPALGGKREMKDTMAAAFLPATRLSSCAPCLCRLRATAKCCYASRSQTICGSDIRCIYHEHLGNGPEGYQGVIAGHEPCGQIVATGEGLPPFQDRRSRDCVPHLRVRRLQRLPPRLHDLLHQ